MWPILPAIIAWKYEVSDSGANETTWAGSVGGRLGVERGGKESGYLGPRQTGPQSLPDVCLAIVGQRHWVAPQALGEELDCV